MNKIQYTAASSLTATLCLILALVPATCIPDFCQSCFSKHEAGKATTIPSSIKLAVIIGCQKCGTTFMHASLIRQPGVAAAINKELHYLDRRQESHTSTTGYIARWKSKALAMAKKDPALRGKSLSSMLDGKVDVRSCDTTTSSVGCCRLTYKQGRSWTHTSHAHHTASNAAVLCTQCDWMHLQLAPD